jgi:hypothetical protein
MPRMRTVSLKWLFAVLMAYLAYGMAAKGLFLRFGLQLPTIGG